MNYHGIDSSSVNISPVFDRSTFWFPPTDLLAPPHSLVSFQDEDIYIVSIENTLT